MKRLLFAASALGAAALAPAANATLVLDESVNGGASFTTVCSGVNACSPGVTFTDPNGVVFLILGASSNAPGSAAAGADITQASVRVTNTTGTTHSLILRAGDTGFTAPTGGTTLSNQISGTVITGNAANLFSSQACANPSNGQNSCVGAFETSVINSNITQSNSAGANSNSLGIASLGAPFSLTEVVSMTLGTGTVLTFTGSADVAAPEPASLAMLGMGLLGLGFVTQRRRQGR